VAGQDARLPCSAVGSPHPQLHWKARGSPIPRTAERIRQLPDGSLQISRIRTEDAGRYTCMVNNKFGQDQVSHELIVNGPPPPPTLAVTGQTTNSITVKLREFDEDDESSAKRKSPVHGYTMYYKPEFGEEKTEPVSFEIY